MWSRGVWSRGRGPFGEEEEEGVLAPLSGLMWATLEGRGE